MKWTKASEKLPELHTQVIVKFNNNRYIACLYDERKKSSAVNKYSLFFSSSHHFEEWFDTIEWLDESNDGWIAVAERLPKRDEIVIGYFPDMTEGGDYVSTAYYDGAKVRSDFPNSTSYAFVATHWQPLPPKPNAPEPNKI